MKTVLVIGTMDTKADELRFAADLIRAAGVPVRLVDVSTATSVAGADVSAEEVAASHPEGRGAALGLEDRGRAVSGMAVALTRWLLAQEDIGGVLGLGGSGNTALVTEGMRALPVTLPKLMVSTVASGNVAPYVGPTDIAMMYSVTDVAGLNAISRRVIGNAAHAIAGMVKWPVPADVGGLPGIGMTMFGVTTTCIDQLRAELAGEIEPYVFHATGTGGQSMEKLVEAGLLSAALDITATEVPDLLMGGVFPCTTDRYGVFARTRRPWVGSVGAVDMVNFGALETVPEKYRDRNLYFHNAQVTLMRTTPPENRAIARFITDALNHCEGEVRLFLPLGGVSAIDAPGMPFHDPEADQALFDEIRATFRSGPNRRLIETEHHINAPAFAADVARHYRETIQ
ncbi:Uncharacterized protein, UPF0261 family [Paracoccus alcaliphilus]|uniref:Uncharacterized protein, UPF0261 family n=1 Tax=Paracoccus alcaliphilus TaxID=34002 RepID=A0A1H8ND28_9RHOB|nr:Tm-1-like ATP-binding domain-containing protein [Paracoccus alcaliphilus]WCR18607.1 Tm-1-like ATP-binding domain-containing protein [Paracoccus alcaliphilus]SEO27452.1 Uncharacterized protein, UPF0261 family [Paracoccus alcaliphilus]